MRQRREFLEICERSLRKYLAMGPESFDADRSILMLECHIICQSNLDNEIFGDVICFKCASICVDCLDPVLSVKEEEIGRKFEEIHRYLKATQARLRASEVQR